jgi:transglutaminase-like putative cysteine protease
MEGQTAADRRRVRVGCEFLYRLTWPVPIVLQVEARKDQDRAIVAESLTTEPLIAARSYVDSYGNRCRRMTLPPGDVRVRYEAEALTDLGPEPEYPGARQHEVADLPDEVLHFTLPSRYCESDLLADTAWQLFGGLEGGWTRTQAINDWVHDNLAFEHQSSDSTTTATDVFRRRRGVCRDFAHLAITFLRALNIPARYCYGYLPDIDVPPLDEPMDFVSWLEAYLGGAWHTFDPRNNVRRTGRVLVGRGRDAVDVAMVTSYGQAELVGMRVVAEDAAQPFWSSADPPVYSTFQS